MVGTGSDPPCRYADLTEIRISLKQVCVDAVHLGGFVRDQVAARLVPSRTSGGDRPTLYLSRSSSSSATGSGANTTLLEYLSCRKSLLDSREVIELLGVHITTLQLWTRKGRIYIV